MIGDWNGIIKIPELYLTHHKWSNEHDLPFVEMILMGGEPLANYHISQVTRMKAKTQIGNDLPIVVVLLYSYILFL